MKAIKKPKPFIASLLLALLLLVYNIPILLFQTSTLSDVVELIVLVGVTTLFIYLISISTILLRILMVTLLLLSSVFLYFILFYKIKIYPPMMMAIFQTDSSEALELVSISLVLWILILGFIPAYVSVVLTKNISANKRTRLIAISIIATLLAIYKFNILGARSYIIPPLKSFKNSYPYAHPSYIFNKHLPYSYIYNARLHLAKAFKYATEEKRDLTATHSFTLQNTSNTDTYFVLVIGESARADRFSLNGYKQNTNPRLSLMSNLVSFNDCNALETHTLGAIPHIFMHEFKAKKESRLKETSLVHILKYIGFKTYWLSCLKSQIGSTLYDIALEADMTAYASSLWHYNAHNLDILPYDHALLSPLKEAIHTSNGGFIVLHTKGSHLVYEKRLPEAVKLYKVSSEPDIQFNKANSLEEAYDNTIRYTDLFLKDIIELLKNRNAIMLYISDHGDSLGEGGVYAHNAPFDTAPREQLHIPMIWWASDKFLSNPVNVAKFENIKRNSSKHVDQSYVFHSVLDCLDIQSTIVNKNKSVCSKWEQ